MIRFVRTVVGLAMVAAGALAVGWALYQLVRTGSCASGGPYISARPCPPGTALQILAIPAALVLLGAGAAISPIAGTGRLAFGLLFTMIGIGALVASFGPAHPPGEGRVLFGLLFGGIFALTGLPMIGLIALVRRGSQARAARLLAAGGRAPGTVVSVQDTGVTINDNPRVRMRVRAEPGDRPPFEFEKTATVPRVAIPRAGDRCAVFYDPADTSKRENVGVSFDAPALAMVGLGGASTAAPAASQWTGTAGDVRLSEEQAERVAEVLSGLGLDDAARTARQATVAGPGAARAGPASGNRVSDLSEDLARLAELHRAGALTDEQFEQAKAKLLGGA